MIPLLLDASHLCIAAGVSASSGSDSGSVASDLHSGWSTAEFSVLPDLAPASAASSDVVIRCSSVLLRTLPSARPESSIPNTFQTFLHLQPSYVVQYGVKDANCLWAVHVTRSTATVVLATFQQQMCVHIRATAAQPTGRMRLRSAKSTAASTAANYKSQAVCWSSGFTASCVWTQPGRRGQRSSC